MGKFGPERLRFQVRAELPLLERGHPGAMQAREACRRFNDIVPAHDGLEDELSVVS